MDQEMIDQKPARPGLSMVTVVIVALLCALIFGLLGYYLGNRTKPEAPATPVAETAVIEETTTALSPTATASTVSWKNYTNAKYNFNLTFNDKWKGLKVFDVKTESNEDISPATDRYYYCIPTTSTKWTDRIQGYACPFTISVFSKAVYDSETQAAQQEGGLSAVNGNKLGETNDYVFVSNSWQDSPEDLVSKGISEDIKNITGSFTVK
jgi:hypothetical protein